MSRALTVDYLMGGGSSSPPKIDPVFRPISDLELKEIKEFEHAQQVVQVAERTSKALSDSRFVAVRVGVSSVFV